MMETTPFNLPNPIPKQYVAFIDVLGFSDLVYKSQHVQLEQYFQTVTEILSEMKRENQKIQSLNISDSIILITPDDLNGLKRLIRAVRKIQRKLMFKNILIRGAVSYGEAFFDDAHNIIVGKGYIRAYQLEAEAIYPRVIIDPSIISHLAMDRTELMDSLNKSEQFNSHSNYIFRHNASTNIENDAIFIDYAYALKEEDTKISPLITTVYNNIKKNLYSDQKFYAKYNWLRNYFVGCITQSLQLTADKSRISVLKDWIRKFERL
ncbi:hypothetical protein [Pedobacter sp. BMA]|uniref:hypothetical protein n=1 Tax=Pedobacter sp. BMA TaxID=1663685 RepID=UPI000A743809|nr:hypothetical protein [Pedobacter sp. BMA]